MWVINNSVPFIYDEDMFAYVTVMYVHVVIF